MTDIKFVIDRSSITSNVEILDKSQWNYSHLAIDKWT